eukprot:1156532-Pelagomonas_calceolata.AAC.19
MTEALGQKDQARASGQMPLWHLPIPVLQNGWTCTTSFWPPVHSARYVALVNQLLEVGDKNQGTRKYTALDKWASQLKSIHTAVQNKMQS